MKKINALIRYEMINLRRGAILWIIGILYAIGVQQAISSMFTYGNSFLSLVGLIKVSWLPLNFIMIPLLLIGMKVGQSENDIFKATNLSAKEVIASKLVALFIIDCVIFLANIIIFSAVGVICSVSIGYFLYQSIGYVINTLTFLIVTTCIGIFIGRVVSRNFREVIGFLINIILFIAMSNFYKTENSILPLFNIKMLSSSFNVISYDKSYVYHGIFWMLMAFILIKVVYVLLLSQWQIETEQRVINRNIIVLITEFAICIFLASNIISMKPIFYDMVSKRDVFNANYSNNNRETFFGKEDCGYYVSKYSMKLNINDSLKNECIMNIKVIGAKVNTVELGLYEKLNISIVTVDDEVLDFKRTNHSFIVFLDRDYSSGEEVTVKVSYEGIINTTWRQGNDFFSVRNNSIFLADVFEWYPKLNDSALKEYDVEIKYSSKNKIYSNLDEESSTGIYKLQGKDSEIFLVSGNIIERKYKDYLFIGNEEYVNSDQQCDDKIDSANNESYGKYKKIVLAPFMPGGTKMDKHYEKAYLFSTY